jgi:hypothetical protein
MEGLTRLVSESLARHGFDRPLDFRRLHWSRWFRCESPHSLLLVPSKPGVFALGEEIMDFGNAPDAKPDIGTAPRRMLAVTQFFEDDDMAFVLDRMLSRQNPMRARLASGRFFVRFVVIEEQAQRRSICNALNQWISSSAEKASAIGAHFASSLELTPATECIPQANDAQAFLFEGLTDAHVGHHVARAPAPASAGTTAHLGQPGAVALLPSVGPATAPQLDSGAATNIHCPSPLPSGF